MNKTARQRIAILAGIGAAAALFMFFDLEQYLSLSYLTVSYTHLRAHET